MNKNERLIRAIGNVNEGYIKEAEKSMARFPMKMAVSLVLIIALGLFLFLPYSPVTSDISGYRDSSYYPLIESIEEYRLSFLQPRYKNNFAWLISSLSMMKDMAPPMNGGAAPDMESGNGGYVESTDNQVEGVIESDIFKMSDKYIFRLAYNEVRDANGDFSHTYLALNVYSIDKENSALVSTIEIPITNVGGHHYFGNEEMYLSADCKTVTVLEKYNVTNNKPALAIYSIDVSDVYNMTVKATATMDGDLNTSRMVDGKLILVTQHNFYRNSIDYSDPQSFVPTIDSGDGPECIRFENIIYPENIDGTTYSVVAMMDSENLELLGANALLNFTNEVYISENTVYIAREYSAEYQSQNGYITKTMTDLAVLNYSGAHLENRGIITMEGEIEDRFSLDERDGYLRAVVSTLERQSSSNSVTASLSAVRNASLYIYDLKDNSLAYSVEDFAIPGESVSAARFDGDRLYVCTAVIVSFTDPVYFFDLSDYENITFSDTGVILGYSDHLINYGEGISLGIGQLDWNTSKVSIYTEKGDKVETVDYIFVGMYSTEYKSYYVNREENLFGFSANQFVDPQTGEQYYHAYILLSFDGEGYRAEVFPMAENYSAVFTRAVLVDGYLYITTPKSLIVRKIY